MLGWLWLALFAVWCFGRLWPALVAAWLDADHLDFPPVSKTGELSYGPGSLPSDRGQGAGGNLIQRRVP